MQNPILPGDIFEDTDQGLWRVEQLIGSYTAHLESITGGLHDRTSILPFAFDHDGTCVAWKDDKRVYHRVRGGKL